MKVRLFLPVAALLLGAAGPVIAQDAMALFQQGRAKVEKGDWAGSCPLFEEAHRLQPEALGILMNLADCQQHTGKLASSWSNYVEAEARAKGKGEAERAQYAHEQAALVEPRLSTLRVNAAATPGLHVSRNDHEIGNGILGTSFPVDAGDHTIKASAPGYKTWTSVVKVQGDKAAVSVDVPALEKLDGSIPPPDGAPPPGGSSVRRPIGFAAIAVGGAGLIVGAVTAGLTASKRSTLLKSCPTSHCLPGQAPALQGDVNTMNTLAGVSTGTFIAGGAVAALGIILVATAPSARPPSTGLVPVVGPRFAGLAGSF